MHVQREGAESADGLGSERLEQPAADAARSSVLPDRHCYLRESLAALVAEQRRLVKVRPSRADPLLAIVGCHEHET